MKKQNIFWGVFLLLIGLLLLLNTFGILPFQVWEIFWPVLLILAGAWLLLGSTLFKQSASSSIETFSLPLQGAQTAELAFHHGAGELTVSTLDASSELLLDGSFAGGLEHELAHEGGHTRLKLRAPVAEAIPFGFIPRPEGYHWQVALSPQLPLALHFKTGASQSSLHLQDLNVTTLKLETGASETSIKLPARTAYTQVEVHSGAAAVKLEVPPAAAARIRIRGGLMGTEIDQTRFPLSPDSQPGDKLYQSPGYAESPHKLDISVETGLGSIQIR